MWLVSSYWIKLLEKKVLFIFFNHFADHIEYVKNKIGVNYIGILFLLTTIAYLLLIGFIIIFIFIGIGADYDGVDG